MSRLRFASASQVRLRGGQAPASARPGRLILAAAWTAAFVAIAGDTPVLACPVCFGAEETSIIQGTKIGVLVMLAITLAVQGAFVGFFLYLRNHARRNAEMELEAEWSELQRASRTS